MSETNFIIIDTSYFIFYRYYALIGWWKLAQPDVELDNPIKNEIFVEKFKKTFIEKLKELSSQKQPKSNRKQSNSQKNTISLDL